jgi:hypothetical protein
MVPASRPLSFEQSWSVSVFVVCRVMAHDQAAASKQLERNHGHHQVPDMLAKKGIIKSKRE